MLEGMPPHQPTTVMRFTTNEPSARAMTNLIGELFDPAESAVAAFEVEDGSGIWLLEAYFSVPPDETYVREMIATVVGEKSQDATFHNLDKTDWVRNSLEGLAPVRAGRFLVHGSHDRDKVRTNDWGLEIEAALAFGTGHHGTTHGCLLALTRLLRQKRFKNVLDVGTGTGVLAFGAARALRLPVYAGDLDPIAVDVAVANARLNRLHPWLKFYVGSGVQHPCLKGKKFDLILANILARPLCRLAHSLCGKLAKGGTLVLSGLLVADVPMVLAAYRTQGLSLKRRTTHGEWVALELGR
jgi:ribosomal protein L11 methyltransferase